MIGKIYPSFGNPRVKCSGELEEVTKSTVPPNKTLFALTETYQIPFWNFKNCGKKTVRDICASLEITLKDGDYRLEAYDVYSNIERNCDNKSEHNTIPPPPEKSCYVICGHLKENAICLNFRCKEEIC